MNYQLHPDFPEEAGMYLEASGFKRSDNDTSKHISFFTSDLAVIATGNTVEFLVLQEEEKGQRNREFKMVAKYTGIQNLQGIFEWMLLFHITGFVSLKDMVKEARKDMMVLPFDIMNLFGRQSLVSNH